MHSLSWILLLLSSISFVVVLMKNNYEKCSFLPLVILFYVVILIYINFELKYLWNSFATIVLFVGYFIRMAICPLLMVLADYKVNIPNSIWLDYTNYAVILLIYEFLCVFIYLLTSKKVKLLTEAKNKNCLKSYELNITTYFIVMFFFLFAVFCILKRPDFLLSIKNTIDFVGFTERENALRNRMYFEMRQNASSLYTLYNTAIVFLQILLPAVILNFIYKNKIVFLTTLHRVENIILGFVVLFFTLLFTTEDNSKSILVAISVFITLLFMYPNSVKKIIPLMFLCGTTFTVVLFLVKTGMFFGRYKGAETIAELINSYFCGIPNIALGMTIEYPNKLITFIGDTVRAVPLAAHFFVDFTNSRTLFNFAYHGVDGYYNQIMPTICYGYKYFGLLAPILPLFIFNWAVKYEIKFHQSDIVFNKLIFAFFAVYFSVCPTMYMFTSALVMLCYAIVFECIVRLNTKGEKKINQ